MRYPLVLTLLLVLTAVGVRADLPSSPRFRLTQSVFGGGASRLSQDDLRSGATSAQSFVGASSSARFVLQSGFWGHAGPGHVPIQLRVGKTIGTPSTADLFWSGFEPSFEIHRSEDCSAVLDHFLDSTTANQYSDPVTPGLHCYLVTPPAGETGRIVPGESRVP